MILGHETLDMVINYVTLAQTDLQEAHLRCSPIDNLSTKSLRRFDNLFISAIIVTCKMVTIILYYET